MMAARPSWGRRRAVLAAASSAGAFLAPRPPRAQGAYPARTVRVVNAYSPGGNADVACRILFAKLSDRLGQSFAVEDRPGAAGPVAAAAGGRRGADGHALL